MALTENTFEVMRALAVAGAVRQAVRNFGHITRATKVPVLNPHLHGALSLSARLGMASGIVANSGRPTPPIAKSNRPDSSLYDEPAKLEKTGRRHHPSKAPGRDASFPNFKVFVDIFASVSLSCRFSLAQSTNAPRKPSSPRRCTNGSASKCQTGRGAAFTTIR
jgi:hypothetical protein